MWFRRTARSRKDREPELLAPRARSEESELAEETDAFVTGRLTDHLADRGLPVPPWAVLNRTAHVSFHELVDIVAGRRGRRARAAPVAPSWASAERKLAFLLLTRGWTPAGVHEAQLDVLVPLELALIDLAEPQGMTTADALDTAAEMLTDYFATLGEG